ncbi:hypothetical protein PORY_001563 [Pneumocystis oryctolagi]|uniref:Uncharacterized protein n=1 Tax=Pneumocystis oryctolagi TaxID=42067 RepID=A0ACB7CBF0_9ASCO|nr:hypothetical protein PORY_001563 [Pneumocystis oryctolagi]
MPKKGESKGKEGVFLGGKVDDGVCEAGKKSHVEEKSVSEKMRGEETKNQAKNAAKAVLCGVHGKIKKRVRTTATFRRPKTLRLPRKPLYVRKSIPHVPRLDAYKVLVCPLNTESSMKKIEENNTLVFRVHLRANKHKIKQAFKKLYNVDVQKEINTLICPNGTKKAYIKLTADMDALDVANKVRRGVRVRRMGFPLSRYRNYITASVEECFVYVIRILNKIDVAGVCYRAMDIDAYKRLTLSETGFESSVTVNQWEIDKILSRYASEHTLFRELLQNSDDACSQSAEIRYETLSEPLGRDNLTEMGRRLCRRLVFKNDGVLFGEADWQRISRIAEGNPDEEKIGAFGVGFYSVFSICEDPFIISGNQTMAFYWKQDQLYVKRATVDTVVGTTFLFQLREPMEIPRMIDLCRFLTTSFAFTKNLMKIELFFDDYMLLSLQKSKKDSFSVPIPKELTLVSPQKTMRLESVMIESLNIHATYLNVIYWQSRQLDHSLLKSKWIGKIFSSVYDTYEDLDPSLEVTSEINLRIASSNIQVLISSLYRKELERITKKRPPKNTKVLLLFSDFSEGNAKRHSKTLFSDLLTYGKQGKVYIGFSTHQTTGFGAHLGAPGLIPTVERENIDLVDKFIKYWNSEILYCSGILSRIIYHYEIQRIVDHFKNDTKMPFVYTMNMFTIEASTPLPISNIIEDAFFSCSKIHSIPLIGDDVIASDRIYLPDSNIDFLPGIPFIRHDVLLESSKFFDKLKYMDMIRQLSADDICNEFSRRTLTIQNTVSFIKWLNRKSNSIDYIMRLKLIGALVIYDQDIGTINFSSLKYFLNTKLIPCDMPLPPICAPYLLTKHFSSNEFEVLDWKELKILEWLQYICTSPVSVIKKDINCLPQFACQVLEIVSNSWEKINHVDRNDIVLLLNSKTCMPTRNHGMRIPYETYFHTVTLFSDLPVIEVMKGVKEKFLSDLGVRKTVEYQVILDRLIKGGEWSHVDLIYYLAESKESIPISDLEKLKETSICKMEGNSSKTYPVSKLYEPDDILRKLTLPIIEWPRNKWNPSSSEALLLFSLGLNRFPPVNVLINLAVSGSSELRERALNFFIVNYYTYNYESTYSFSKSELKFLPIEGDNKQNNVESPKRCFTNKFCSVFGFKILRHDLISEAKKFGVESDPDIGDVVSLLVKFPPCTFQLAQTQFEYLASRVGELKKDVLEKLNKAKFIPIHNHHTKEVKHLSPNSCFLEGDESSFYDQIFSFVDFGHKANVFLKACGTMSQPTFPQLAELLLKDPEHVFNLVKTPQKYQDILRKLVVSSYFCKNKNIYREMMDKPFLLASRKRKSKVSGNKLLSENQESLEYFLSDASSIFVIDDVVSYNLFGEFILSAPQEDILEDFYQSLGSKRLSSVVREEYKFKGPAKENLETASLRKLFIDRCGLFLHETSTALLHDRDWLISNLNVAYLENIKLERILKFKSVDRSHEHSVTCALNPEYKCSLYVTKNWDSYDVAQVLCKVMLQKPVIHDSLLLSSLIITDLDVLQQRGYNVQRILHAQDLKKKEEEEFHKINLQQNDIKAETEKYNISSELQDGSYIKYPGSYPFEDELKSVSGNGNLFESEKNDAISTSLRKSEFLKKNTQKSFRPFLRSQKQYDCRNNENKEHKEYKEHKDVLYENKERKERKDVFYENVSLLKNYFLKKVKIRNTLDVKQPANYEQDVVSNLLQAIKASKNSNELSIFSPAEVIEVKEANEGYCNISYSHNLKFVNRTADNINVYVSKDMHSGELYINDNKRDIELFSSEILRRISDVFGFHVSIFNIFYDENGLTISFNRGGSIFCNLRYYMSLHSKKLMSGGFRDVLAFWFVTIAHELSHNIVSEHGQVHSFYTESFISYYMTKLVKLF